MTIDPYFTPDEAYAEGVVDVDYSPEEIEAKEVIIRAYIERLTNQFFNEQEKVVYISGNGGIILKLPFPPLEIEKISFRSSSTGYTEYAMTNFVVFNDFSQGDRDYPRIGIDDYSSKIFPEGTRNIKIEGTFGYVDADGNVPGPIKRAALMILMAWLPTLSTAQSSSDLIASGQLKRQKAGDDEVEFFANISSSSTLTGIKEVDSILSQYIKSSTVDSI